ncbi:hypothetical protein D3C81_1585440 [compost metagenome]
MPRLGGLRVHVRSQPLQGLIGAGLAAVERRHGEPGHEPGDGQHHQQFDQAEALLMTGCYWDRYAVLRGQARSHRFGTGLQACMYPVGAGLPAKGHIRLI